jgi:hypothetical protein
MPSVVRSHVVGTEIALAKSALHKTARHVQCTAPPSSDLSNAALLLLLPKWTLPDSATSQSFLH